jgi:DNA gyrase subunit A
MGRTACGVRGVTLDPGHQVIALIVADGGMVLSVTENGYGKRTPLSDYRPQGRGGKGLITIKCSDRNGPLLAIRDVHPGEELMVITRGGIMIRIALDEVSKQGRNTQGVRIINLNDGDKVASIAKIGREEAESAAVARTALPDDGGEGQVADEPLDEDLDGDLDADVSLEPVDDDEPAGDEPPTED